VSFFVRIKSGFIFGFNKTPLLYYEDELFWINFIEILPIFLYDTFVREIKI